MAEKQVARRFSQEVDSLLAGKGQRSHDPLLALAAEMAAGPEIDPSESFEEWLRRELQLSMPSARVARTRRRWSLAGVALMLLLALALALVWNPGVPSAPDVLARVEEDAFDMAPGPPSCL